MFGVCKNFYPFIYFKNTGIYDMSHLKNAPRKISDINILPYNPSDMDVYYKDIQVTKKNLMTVCK